jgi:putative membrane protein
MKDFMMQIISLVLIGLVALEHLYFLALEMFLWTKPSTRRIFGMNAEDAETTKTLAANQGLYNGFLAAGLGYSLIASDIEVAFTMKIFFLACVIAAGLYGGITVSRRIILVQALPAFIALILVLLS